MRRQLEAGASAERAAPLTVSPAELVRGEPGDWLASYLKYHQLLWARYYEGVEAMCPREEASRGSATGVTDALREAARASREELARLGTSFEGVTPLHTAAFFCRPSIARLLLEHGAEVDPRDGTGLTPLHWASCAELAELLIESGADVSAASLSGLTPLHTAVDVHVVRLLIERGADANARDRCGNAPLHFASLMGLSFGTGSDAIPLGADPELREAPLWVRVLVRVLDDTIAVAQLLAERFDVVRAMTTGGADTTLTNAQGHVPTQLIGAGGGGDWD